MDLAKLLAAPAQLEYDHLGDKDQPAQIAVTEIRDYLRTVVPPGYLVKQSGIAHNLPFIAWVAILDSDQTSTTQSGIFIVFLYSQDMSKLYLSLNQGFTSHESKAQSIEKTKRTNSVHNLAIESITSDTKVLKEQLSEDILSLPKNIDKINLESEKHLAEGYMAGHIAGFEYNLKSLPSESEILKDLELLYPLYAKACAVSDQNTLLNPGTWTTTSGDNEYKRSQVTKNSVVNYNEFVPKDSTPVKVKYKKSTVHNEFKSRKHEKLIEDFVGYIHQFDFMATNTKIGKRDLLIKNDLDIEFLVEAKTVKTDGEEAVRDAIGQLLAYRYEYYEKDNRPELIALFNLRISDIWQGLLDELHIEWVFIHNGNWIASKRLTALFTRRSV